MVTNRHVFENREQVVVRFNPEEASTAAREYPVDLKNQNGQRLWLAHDNPDVDVAVLAINAKQLQQDRVKFAVFQSDKHVASLSKVEELGVSEGDGVYVLGFPMGLVGGERNFVIVRQGVIARIRDAVAKKGAEVLIDATVFPGNSGGPVVTRPEIASVSGTRAVGAAYLVGLVRSYVPYRDVALSAQTQRPRVIFEENSGLAAVVPIDFVQEVIRRHVQTLPEVPAAPQPTPES